MILFDCVAAAAAVVTATTCAAIPILSTHSLLFEFNKLSVN